MKRLEHEMILASAGTGKTYALVTRYIKLLALGVEPSRIGALTFTRKAAGEFLQKIFLRLTEAVQDEAAAARLTWETGVQADPDRYLKLLTKLIHEIGNLQLGTIDSFFGRIVTAFPYELGLLRPHRIMEAFEMSISRERALAQLLGHGDDQQAQDLIQFYKAFTWGTESKAVYRVFEEQLTEYYALFLEAGHPDDWGNGQRIFTDKPWWMVHAPEKEKLVEAIRTQLDNSSFKPSVRKAFNRILDNFEAWTPGTKLDGGSLFERLLEGREALAEGNATFTFSRTTFDVDGPLAADLYRLIQSYVQGEVGRRLVTTRSLGCMLDSFDRQYESLVRESGSLVFADLPMLLIKGLCEGETAFGSADMVYRMDGQTDHWLVDEFQDTSRIQWKVLSAFIDEVLQDPGGERSFFYVGDVKQSIYGWRGGDSRLFEEIFTRYGEGGKHIRQQDLTVSYRSGPAILECVNTVFDKAITPELAGMEAAERWNRQWHPHKPSPLTIDQPGHAAWGMVESGTSIEEACIDLIQSVQPLDNGLSCAVLMRKNSEVTAMTEALRAAGIPASMEGTVHVAMDNLVGCWIRAFLLSLARPGDRFARAYPGLPGFGIPDERIRKARAEVRTAISREGYAEGIRLLLDVLKTRIKESAFLQRRSEQLLEAATRFEETGATSIEAFIRYLESATVEESTTRSRIQVMTVHKAKGLDFNMVIVAGFGNDPLVSPHNRKVHVERQVDGEIEWILDLPNKDIVQQEPRLMLASEGAHSRETFEALCLLYVAMTRARNALYCIAANGTTNRNSTTWQDLYTTAFGLPDTPREDGRIHWYWERGESCWTGRMKSPEVPGLPRLKLTSVSGELPSARPILRRALSPSAEAHAMAFEKRPLRSPMGRRFGTRMHEFLATIEWIDFTDKDSVEAILARTPLELADRLRQFFDSPEGPLVFAKPGQAVQLWREKPYVLRQQSAVSHGIIDRATLYLDAAGRPEQLAIYDFKTDQLNPDQPAQEQLMEKYALQLERYVEASQLLTGLPASAITTTLVPV